MHKPRFLSSRKALAGLIVAGAVMAPVAAFAVAGFDDVPAGHTHEDGIQWVKDSGVTAGCSPTEYCPDDSVTRAQMATFMHRLSGHASGISPSVDADSVDGLDAAQIKPFASATGSSAGIYSGAFSPVPGASVTVELPAEGVIEAEFSAETACSGGTGWCTAQILVDGSPIDPDVDTDFAFDSTDGGAEGPASWEGHTVRRISGTLPAGTYDVTVEVGSTSGGPPDLRVDDWALTAEGHLG